VLAAAEVTTIISDRLGLWQMHIALGTTHDPLRRPRRLDIPGTRSLSSDTPGEHTGNYDEQKEYDLCHGNNPRRRIGKEYQRPEAATDAIGKSPECDRRHAGNT
jgi:hypothetical protein